MKQLPLHKLLQVLAWLEGTWMTDEPANCTYPSMKTITYYDQINITSIGQPLFNYIAQSWHSETGIPMHRETGFLQILPESQIILNLVNNAGIFVVEQGKLSDDNKSFEVRSSNVVTTEASIASFASLTQTHRVYKFDGEYLDITFYMATVNTPELTEHLHARYKKIDSNRKHHEHTT